MEIHPTLGQSQQTQEPKNPNPDAWNALWKGFKEPASPEAQKKFYGLKYDLPTAPTPEEKALFWKKLKKEFVRNVFRELGTQIQRDLRRTRERARKFKEEINKK